MTMPSYQHTTDNSIASDEEPCPTTIGNEKDPKERRWTSVVAAAVVGLLLVATVVVLPKMSYDQSSGSLRAAVVVDVLGLSVDSEDRSLPTTTENLCRVPPRGTPFTGVSLEGCHEEAFHTCYQYGKDAETQYCWAQSYPVSSIFSCPCRPMGLGWHVFGAYSVHPNLKDPRSCGPACSNLHQD